MPPPAGAVSFQAAAVAELLGNPALIALAVMLFLYVAAEVGVWNWLARHLIAQGVPEKRALTILSLGFALGLLLGRVAVSPMLSTVSPEDVLMGSAVLMAITTYLMLQTSSPNVAWVAVFLAGIAMAPVFPTTLAVVNMKFPGYGRHGHRHRGHGGLAGPGGEFADHRRHRRRRSEGG
jgi:fucose permease